ncbi:MAG: RAMP superfamily CRISPR-associated protein [Gammaproteobacteria bacterium]
MTELRVRITFESDWHIGEGSGQPGHIDRLVRREPSDGMPYVPAKTLTGIWRDACEQVAAGLDEGSQGTWQEWVKVLFGGIDFVAEKEAADQARLRDKPRSALLAVRPARFPEALRCCLNAENYASLREVLTFIKPGVSLNEYGVAREDHLRMEEVVCANAVLESVAELSVLDDPARETALALLWAGARVTERIGGKRRRGYGRCRLELAGADLPSETRLLENLAAKPVPVPSPSIVEPRRFAKPVSAGEAPAWHVIKLDLELLSPVVAFDGALGNVVKSKDYIPGTHLLAALNGKLRQLLGDAAFPAIARGDVRALNAYPILDGTRALPIPLAFHYEKEQGGLDEGGKVYNHLATAEHGSEQRKQQRQGYVAGVSSNGCLPFCAVEIQATTHGTIDDEHQRPTPRVGGVFTFQAIRAGARLCSEIWIDRSLLPELRDDAIARLDGTYRLGKAKKDDYGQVRLSATRGEMPAAPQPMDHLILWLTSPLLLRNERLRPSTDHEVLRQELERRLEVKLEESPERPGPFMRVDRSEGWHLGWGLPRPSLVGLAAGSCLCFKVQGALSENSLSALQLGGLGERRAEGFGEIVVNPTLLTIEHFDVIPSAGRPIELSDATVSGEQALSGESLLFAHHLTRRAWQAAILSKALANAPDRSFRQDKLGWDKKEPPNSQIGTLRSLLEGLNGESGGEVLQAWLIHLRETSNRWDKWPEPARKALENLVRRPERVWEWLGVAKSKDFPEVPGLSMESLKRELLWDAVRAVWLAAIHSELRDREREEA